MRSILRDAPYPARAFDDTRPFGASRADRKRVASREDAPSRSVAGDHVLHRVPVEHAIRCRAVLVLTI
jgi:hypothetical protein